MTDEQKPLKLDDLVRKVESLCRNVEALEKSVSELAGRLLPSPYDHVHRESWDLGEQRKAKPTAFLLRDLMIYADERLEGLERDFHSVRSKIDAYEKGTYLSDDIQTWIRMRQED